MYKVEKRPCIFEPPKPNPVAPSAVELSGGEKPRLPASNTTITSTAGTGVTATRHELKHVHRLIPSTSMRERNQSTREAFAGVVGK